MQYFDKNGKEIRAGMKILMEDGSIEMVYDTEDQYGNPNLGINASNEEFLKLHPNWAREYYSLSMFKHNCNSRSIETFNIFEHGSFREYVKKAAKKYQNREDFAKQLRSEVMYYFWSKCEWEVLVTPWISPRESEKKKIDVCWQIMNNWDVFVDYTWANRKKL